VGQDECFKNEGLKRLQITGCQFFAPLSLAAPPCFEKHFCRDLKTNCLAKVGASGWFLQGGREKFCLQGIEAQLNESRLFRGRFSRK
jgi:hypothetical protein